jgi:predicted nucleotidyltransferase
MTCLTTDALSPALREKISPFFHEILENSAPQIHSIYLVGSVLTEDYLEQTSKIDSVIVLQKMDLAFLDVLAPLGNKYGKRGLAAPSIMDPGYIHSSVDVFPLEFLNYKLRHQALYGEDLLAGLEIDRQELRYQCERELKGKIIWLHRIYVSAMGDKKVLAADIVRHFDGYPPLFRGMLHLLGQDPPGDLKTALSLLGNVTGTDTGVFMEIYAIQKNLTQPSQEEISQLFKKFYRTIERLAEVVDGNKTT